MVIVIGIYVEQIRKLFLKCIKTWLGFHSFSYMYKRKKSIEINNFTVSNTKKKKRNKVVIWKNILKLVFAPIPLRRNHYA